MNTITDNSLALFEKTGSNVSKREDVGIKPASNSDSKSTEAEVKTVAEPKSLSTAEMSADFFADIKENLQKINDFIPVSSTNLIFEFDELGEPPVVKVIDKENDEVIREIPPQEFREVAKALESLADKLSSNSGILFNDVV
jgi:flagellar protein FlaG